MEHLPEAARIHDCGTINPGQLTPRAGEKPAQLQTRNQSIPLAGFQESFRVCMFNWNICLTAAFSRLRALMIPGRQATRIAGIYPERACSYGTSPVTALASWLQGNERHLTAPDQQAIRARKDPDLDRTRSSR